MNENEPTLEEAKTEQSFDELIAGKYREDYLSRVQDVLDRQMQAQSRYSAYQRLLWQAEQAKTEYPDFSLDRELEDPAFLRLIRGGTDPKTAYQAVHHRELLQAAQAEQAKTQQRMAQRPVENGLGRGSVATVYRPDPRSLSREERKQLRRRAGRGEKIVW